MQDLVGEILGSPAMEQAQVSRRLVEAAVNRPIFRNEFASDAEGPLMVEVGVPLEEIDDLTDSDGERPANDPPPSASASFPPDAPVSPTNISDDSIPYSEYEISDSD